MNTFKFLTSAVALSCAALSPAQSKIPERPNILFALGDDITWKHMEAYGCKWVKTPNFNLVAKNGVLFNNAYTCNAKCAPSRSSILTGRNSWQLEAACNHFPYFPEKFKTYAEALAEHGYHVGFTGKGWAPGNAGKINGVPRSLPGKEYAKYKLVPPTKGISNCDYASNFEDFVNNNTNGKPFCFWFGSNEPHRDYEFASSLRLTDKRPGDIDSVPAFWPQNETVRTDMLDYALEIEHFDKHLGLMLEFLKKKGLLDNTIVVVTADNGMPFPRVKGQEYEWSNHLPLAIMWKNGIKSPGRKIDDFVSFIDFTPTFLEVAGISQKESKMATITGKSLTDILYSNKNGVINSTRNHVLIGKERHDVGRPNDEGYPIRGIRKGDFLYVHNFKTNRWPAGDPITGYLNCDGSPTKTEVLKARRLPETHWYWKLDFGKRTGDELYNVVNDAECMTNLATNQQYAKTMNKLRKQLFKELKEQKDPRILGNDTIFDQYPYSDPKTFNFYNRQMQGEKMNAGWVEPSDAEILPPGEE